MRRPARFVWALILAAAGCSTSSGDGGGTCGGGVPFDAGVAACNALVTDGPCVTYQSADGTPPAATGGAIVAGTYVLTAVDTYAYYTPDTSLSEKLWLTNVTATSLTYDLAVVSDTQTIRQEGVGALVGPAITLTPLCPAGATTTTAQYGATATTFTLTQGPAGAQEVATFTMQ